MGINAGAGARRSRHDPRSGSADGLVEQVPAEADPAAVVIAQHGRDPLSGDLFVFRNRRGNRLTILAWQGDGFRLYLQRLEPNLAYSHPAVD